MKGLLLAEKPSVMRAIQEVYKKEQASLPDVLEFGAFHGHLMELRSPEEYDASWEDRQNMAILPMIPSTFSYKPSDRTSVNRLMEKIRQGKYDFLVNACDAGREGEHIFWSFYETMGLNLPVKRLWTSSITKPALKNALHALKPAALYDGMRIASKYRAQFDWLVGMNFSRVVSVKMQQTAPIGRVQSPTLKLIVDRELEIQNFKPEDFYEVKCDIQVGGGTAAGCVHLIAPDHKNTRFKDKAAADRIAKSVKASPNGVVAMYKENVQEADAPTLYSLAELEKDANKYLGLSPKKTDSIAQSLYESGFITYPRSESRYLPTDMIPEIPAHLAVIKVVPELANIVSGIGQTEIDAMLKKHYIDDAGITDHHAVIPTDNAPEWNKLTKDEQALYTLVCKSFLAIFLPPYKAAISTVVFDISGNLFAAKGRRELDKGYSILYPAAKSRDVPLPKCVKGEPATAQNIKVQKSTTKPPSRYTPRTILTAMQNVGNAVSDLAMRSILHEASGLGTSATRSDILQKLEDRDLVEVKQNKYFACTKGIELIQAVGDRAFCSPILTAQWENKLRQIEKGTFTGDFPAEMREYIKEETAYLLGNLAQVQAKVVGTCPVCGGKIVERQKSFQCEHRRKGDANACPVWIPKDIGGYLITQEDVDALLSMKETETHTVKTKLGTNMLAKFSLDKTSGLMLAPVTNYVGTCPICGKRVISYAKSYTCEGNTKESPQCSFWIPRTVSGYTLTDEDTKTLLEGKTTGERTLTKKDGTKWKVFLSLDEEKQLKLESAEKKKSVGKCPLCGNDVLVGRNNFYCSNSDCSFSIAKLIKGGQLTEKDAAAMLAHKKTRQITFIWSSGREGKARLYLQGAKLCWDFS